MAGVLGQHKRAGPERSYIWMGLWPGWRGRDLWLVSVAKAKEGEVKVGWK